MIRLTFRKTNICLAAACIGLCLTALLHGQETEPALAHIGANTSVLVRIDAAVLEALIEAGQPTDKASQQSDLQQRLEQTRKILDGDPVWLTVGFPQLPLSTKIIIRDPDGKRINALKELWDFPGPQAYRHRPPVVIKALSKPDSQRPPTASRLDQWKKLMAPPTDESQGRMIQFGCLPPTHLYDTYRELITNLPDYLGGGPITLLTDGMLTVSGTIDAKNGSLEATIDSASPAAATAFAQRLNQLLTSADAQRVTQMLASFISPETEKAKDNPLAAFYQQLRTSTFKPDKHQVHWQVQASKDWKPRKVLELALGSAFNHSAVKRLRNLGLAIHNYESAHGHFPPSVDARDPKKNRLSWRVQVLPYFGEHQLYRKFALDEPWDSPTNIELLPEMPSIYSDYGSKLLAPANAKPGYTTVVAPSSEKTILGASHKVTFRSITDGTSNTILLVVLKDKLAVPWTAPQDYVFDPEQPAAGLKFTDGKTLIVLSDCRTKQLVKDNDWVALFEMNDSIVARPKE